MIKAIETKYKGYRFRSRLEARWAVFFDALGVQWEYEAEGYDLGDAGYYLPDFYLPIQGCHIEIKPSGDVGSDARLKCFRLADGLGKPVVLFSGSPGYNTEDFCEGHDVDMQCFDVLTFFGWHEPDETVFPSDKWFWECNFIDGMLRDFLVDKGYTGLPLLNGESKAEIREYVLKLIEVDRDYYLKQHNKNHPFWEFGFGAYQDHRDGPVVVSKCDQDIHFNNHVCPRGVTPRVAWAIDKARQARFEHGENG